MSKFKVRYKKCRGRSSKVMKLMESILNDPKVNNVLEEATYLQMRDQIVFGGILPETEEKIDKLLKSITKI